MKHLISICLILLVNPSLFAQNMQYDFQSALDIAKENKQHVLMVFSGSDWCKPCIQLRTNILESQEFVNFGVEHLVLLELDFPYKKKNKLSKDQEKHNAELAERYNKEGTFPKLILFDGDAKLLQNISIDPKLKPTEFIEVIQSIIQKNY